VGVEEDRKKIRDLRYKLEHKANLCCLDDGYQDGILEDTDDEDEDTGDNADGYNYNY